MAVTRLTSSWLGYDQDTGLLVFWDGARFRPLQEAVGYATSGDVTAALAGYLPLTGGTLTGALGLPLFTVNGLQTVTADVNGLYVGGSRLWHQGNDGSGSGLDADLLDGHDSGYFAAASALSSYLLASVYTAADVLSKVKSVDGSGSGLDADLLDGHDSGYFTDIVARLGYTPLNSADGILFRGLQSYVSSATWTKPSGVTKVLAFVWGGGGGGGGAGGGAAKGAAGAGGGAGGFGWELIDVSAVSSVAVTIGAGGTAGSSAGGTGGTGGTTSFGGYLSATGGIGGIGMAADTFAKIVQGGSGGTASGGDFNVTGSGGSPGFRLDYQNGIAGHGAPAARLAGGGNGFAGNTAGQNGYARGDGGGGGVVSDNATGRTGGTGGSGMVWLWEFA